jgi:hypothetical protein
MAYTIRRTLPIISIAYHSDGQYYTVCVDADFKEQHFTKGELMAYLSTLIESEVDFV